MESMVSLYSLSAVDGRYHEKVTALCPYFSEAALIRYRIEIEVSWLKVMVQHHTENALDAKTNNALDVLFAKAGDEATACRVKAIEKQTRHDVKAVEYWIGEQLDAIDLSALKPWVHFACTSWDINNIAYTKQSVDAVKNVLIPQLETLQNQLGDMAIAFADVPMLSRTHGQPASPTTMGKELANVVYRLAPRLIQLRNIQLPGKFNGAVGNYNAHVVAYPNFDWQTVTADFVSSWGLRPSAYTTQIEPYDDLTELFDLLRRINTILIDFCRDCWSYIASDYFIQQSQGGLETGSSTMPHKINPIDFENAEGNLGIANALLSHLADKLPISRWQRDLTDSTVLRSVGTAMGHLYLAWQGVCQGLGKLSVNQPKLQADLNNNYQVLTEAIQTVLRAQGCTDAYEQLKLFSRGKSIDKDSIREFVQSSDITEPAKQQLLSLTPDRYTGLASDLAKAIKKHVN